MRNYADAKRSDRAAYAAFFHAMLDAGVYLAPSAFEAAFTSAVHGEAELAAFEAALGIRMAAVAVVGGGLAGSHRRLPTEAARDPRRRLRGGRPASAA